MHYYGYERTRYFASNKAVKYPRLFIGIIGILLDLKIIDCTKTELANVFFEIFCLSKNRSTIRKWFYETYPEYETFLTNLTNLFSTLKINE